MKLVVATGNPGKLEEFRRILTPLGVEVCSLREVGAALEVEETGETFLENAAIKADEVFRLTGLPAVADDSGLCVDALDGRPGVYSARYGGDAPYSQKMDMLLEELREVPAQRRGAQFVSAIYCRLDGDIVISCEGVCRGRMAFAPSGSGGFGYDPLFLVEGESFASLSPAQKDAVSHRGKALRDFVQKLRAHLRDAE